MSAMSNRKRALITGITGQDGSYLAELLLEKGYASMALNAGQAVSTPPGSITSTRIPMSGASRDSYRALSSTTAI